MGPCYVVFETKGYLFKQVLKKIYEIKVKLNVLSCLVVVQHINISWKIPIFMTETYILIYTFLEELEHSILKEIIGASKMAPWVKALSTKPDLLNLISWT